MRFPIPDQHFAEWCRKLQRELEVKMLRRDLYRMGYNNWTHDG